MSKMLRYQFENNLETIKNVLHYHNTKQIILPYDLVQELEAAVERSKNI